MANVQITEQSKSLFIAYFNDAGNWNGNPAIGHNVGDKPANKGNLTQLKGAGLVTAWVDEGHAWLSFTQLGLEYAAEIGLLKDF